MLDHEVENVRNMFRKMFGIQITAQQAIDLTNSRVEYDKNLEQLKTNDIVYNRNIEKASEVGFQYLIDVIRALSGGGQ